MHGIRASRSCWSDAEFSIHEVVEQVTALNESLVAKKGLTLERYLSTELPPVRGDRDKVIHVLTNLLGNAFEFTPSGGRVWVNASMSPEDPANLVLIEVGDTGRGIAPDHHELIFREFAQVDSSASRAHHGTGLGLTIARTIRRAAWRTHLGGKRAGMREPVLLHPSSTARRRMSARVLLVEDSPMINGALKLLLEAGGFEVTLATTAAEAASWQHEEPADVMLLDIGLPDEDGLNGDRGSRRERIEADANASR